MKRVIGLSVAMMLLGACAQKNPEFSKLYVANITSSDVSVVDLKDFREIKRIKVNSMPYHITYDREKKRAYVANMGDQSVSVLDTEKDEVITSVMTAPYPKIPQHDKSNTYTSGRTCSGCHKNIRVSTMGSMPHQVYKAANALYVVNAATGKITDLDPETFKARGYFPVGTKKSPMPLFMVLTPDKKNYLVSMTDMNFTFSTKYGPQEKKKGYKSLYGDENLYNELAVLDVNTMKQTGQIKVGYTPINMVFTPDGKTMYVSNWGSDDISVVDMSTQQETKRISTQRTPVGLQMMPDGKHLYVANYYDGYLTIIDTQTNEKIKEMKTPGANPDHLILSPDHKFLYLSLTGAQSITKFEIESQTFVQTIPVGGFPLGMELVG